MRKLIAIWVGKLLAFAGRLFGKKVSSGPGEYALRICPDLVSDLKKHVKKGIVVTCGTNGKTTTNNLICSALESKGYKVLCNRLGANMLSGVATAYIEEANIFGKLSVDYACLEIDEAYARIVYDYVKPDVMVITNLFRDQLDRYGEVDITTKVLKDAIAKVDGLKLILNADDPLCARFKEMSNATPIFYGVSEPVLEQNNTAKEGKFCPMCGEALDFNYHHYSQLGDYKCPKCHFKRPDPNVEVKNVSLKTPMSFTINGKPIQINYKGFYNIYNIIAVYAALGALGESTDDFSKILDNFKPQIGRMQEFNFNKPVILSLSKNPAGFNQAIDTVNTDDRKKDVVIAVNDMPSDGQDISWLWDVDFDKLKNEKLGTLTTSGARMWDLALRFKYADIKVDSIEANMKKIILNALKTDSEVVYLIVNYTVLFPTESILQELLKEGGNNEN